MIPVPQLMKPAPQLMKPRPPPEAGVRPRAKSFQAPYSETGGAKCFQGAQKRRCAPTLRAGDFRELKFQNGQISPSLKFDHFEI